MKFLIFMLTLSLVYSCKTSSNSKAKSVVFERNGFSHLFFSTEDNLGSSIYLYHKCATDSLPEVLRTRISSLVPTDYERSDKELIARVSEACTDFVTSVDSAELFLVIQDMVANPSISNLASVRNKQVERLKLELTFAESRLSELNNLIISLSSQDNVNPKTVKLNAEFRQLKANLSALSNQISIQENMTAKDLKLQSLHKTLSLIKDYHLSSASVAENLRDLVKDSSKLYSLNYADHGILIDALSSFEPKCGDGVGVQETVTKIEAFKEVTYQCKSTGTLEVISSKCRSGYDPDGDLCKFTGNGLEDSFQSAVMFNGAVCGRESRDKVKCFGYASEFFRREVCELTQQGTVECKFVTQREEDLEQQINAFGAVYLDGDANALCGLNESGNARCWYSQARDEEFKFDGTYTDIGVFRDAACAIRKVDSTIQCFGYAVEENIPNVGPYTKVDVGDGFACALAQSGKIDCWGEFLPSNTVTDLSGQQRWQKIKVGNSFGCGTWISGDQTGDGQGNIRCFGYTEDIAGVFQDQSVYDFSLAFTHICWVDVSNKMQCGGFYALQVRTDQRLKSIFSDHNWVHCAITEADKLLCFSDLSL